MGSDRGSVTPVLEDIKERTGQLPVQLLADINNAKHECIEAASRAGTASLIAVLQRERDATRPGSSEVTAWRKRMHGIAAVRVRGLARVMSVVLLGAITASFFRMFQQGVASQAGEDDSRMLYDLGIACLEMGQVNGAIDAFRRASKDPARTCVSLSMIATAYRSVRQLDAALNALHEAASVQLKVSLGRGQCQLQACHCA